MNSSSNWAEVVTALSAATRVPAIDVDLDVVVAKGRRRLRRRTVAASTVAVAAIVGAGVTAPLVLGQERAGHVPVASQESEGDQSGDESEPPVVDPAFVEAVNKLAPLIDEYPDVLAALRWNDPALELLLTAGADRTQELKADVEALDLPIEVVYVPSSPVSSADLTAALAALFESTEDWAPGLTYHWVRVDTDRGALVFGVDADQLERWREHLATVDLGVPAIAEPGGPIVPQ